MATVPTVVAETAAVAGVPAEVAEAVAVEAAVDVTAVAVVVDATVAVAAPAADGTNRFRLPLQISLKRIQNREGHDASRGLFHFAT